MNLVSTVTYQVVIMFLLAGIGALMFRSGKISLEGSKSIGSILVNLSLPAVIINGFLVERTPERITGLLLSGRTQWPNLPRLSPTLGFLVSPLSSPVWTTGQFSISPPM